MKTHPRLRIYSNVILVIAALHLLTPSLRGQGSLTPPAAPTPTMKSLDQIEPRTLISSLPYTISTSGSYYLTSNLTWSTGSAGITVNVSNVTIDLNGFTLSGSGGSNVPGITVPGFVSGLFVRNGTISGWSGNGVDGTLANGATIEKVDANGNAGIGILIGPSSVVRACQAHSNTVGIQTGSYSKIEDCLSSLNSGDGFHASFDNLITNCSATENINGTGFNCGDFSTVINCTAISNTGSGSAGYGILTGVGSKVTNCNAGQSGQSGIVVDVGSSVQGCQARGNTLHGIAFTSNCLISGNNCDHNNTAGTSTNAGIYTVGSANTIDSNSSTSNGNGLGISTPSPATKNIIIRNSCSGNGSGNYQVGSSAYGPIIDMSAGGAISSASGTVNPWTNWIH